MIDGVAIAEAALEYFQEQHNVAQSAGTEARLRTAEQVLVSAKKFAAEQYRKAGI